MSKYEVVEKFVSINGEGTKAGQLAVFIRFKGCNLNCKYCDTKWANEQETPSQPMTEKEILDYYAVGQCTPGVIAVNTATFIGYKLRGIIGGIVATLGVIFPSIVIILIIATFLQNFADLAIVQSAFAGIRVAVVALIITTVVKLIKSSIKDYLGVIIAIIAFVISAFIGLSPVYVVIAAALTGFISKGLRGDKK